MELDGGELAEEWRQSRVEPRALGERTRRRMEQSRAPSASNREKPARVPGMSSRGTKSRYPDRPCRRGVSQQSSPRRAPHSRVAATPKPNATNRRRERLPTTRSRPATAPRARRCVYDADTHGTREVAATCRAEGEQTLVYVADELWELAPAAGGPVLGQREVNAFMAGYELEGRPTSYQPDRGVLAVDELVFGSLPADASRRKASGIRRRFGRRRRGLPLQLVRRDRVSPRRSAARLAPTRTRPSPSPRTKRSTSSTAATTRTRPSGSTRRSLKPP